MVGHPVIKRACRTRERFFFKNHAENETCRLVPDLFLFFAKAYYEVKASDLQPSFNIFKLYETLDY